LVNFVADPLGEDESTDSRETRCRAQAERVRRALDDFTDKAARLAEIDPDILTAGWGSRSGREQRDQP
jgi:hypothetical protein